MKRPTVDLEYPTQARGKIPSFHSLEEEAAFWDSHDVTDVLDDSARVAVVTDRGLVDRITLRLDQEDRVALDRHARSLGVASSTLIRIWLKERLRQEASRTG